MVEEGPREKYARATGQHGTSESGEMGWLIKQMSEELKYWGHTGGAGGSIILKCDGENAIAKVRDTPAKYHGGRVSLEQPGKRESQSNGGVEEW